MVKKIKVVDIVEEENAPIEESKPEVIEDSPTKETVDVESSPIDEVKDESVVEVPVVEKQPPKSRKKVSEIKEDVVIEKRISNVRVTPLVTCPSCKKRMTEKTLKYSHSSVCGITKPVVKKSKTYEFAETKPQIIAKPRAKTEVIKPIKEDEAMTPHQLYHDIVRQRNEDLRQKREHRIKSLFSKAV